MECYFTAVSSVMAKSDAILLMRTECVYVFAGFFIV